MNDHDLHHGQHLGSNHGDLAVANFLFAQEPAKKLAKAFIKLALFAFAIIAAVFSATAPVYSQTVDREALVERFLVQHKLSRLLVVHREIEAFENPVDAPRSADALAKFHQALAEQLFQNQSDAKWSDQLVAKAKRSLTLNPGVDDRWLRLAILHHQTERLRAAFLNSDSHHDLNRDPRDDSDDRSPQEDADNASIQDLSEELRSLNRSITTQIEHFENLRGLKQLDANEGMLLIEARRQHGHGQLLLGWSSYLQWAADQPRRRETLRDAESYFRDYLAVPPYLNLTKFNAQQLDVTNNHRRSALIGLAMVMRGVGADVQADHCFSIAASDRIAASNRIAASGWTQRDSRNSQRREVFRWDFAGCLAAGNLPAAAMLLKQKPELVRDPVIIKSIVSRDDLPIALKQNAIVGATLNFEINRVNRLRGGTSGLADLGLNLSMVAWIEGYSALAEYRASGEAIRLAQAQAKLNQAIDSFTNTDRRDAVGHCHFLLGRVLFTQKEYPAAAKQFLMANELLNRFDSSLSGEAIYFAIRSLHGLPSDQGAAIDRLTNVLREQYSHLPYADLAEVRRIATRPVEKNLSPVSDRLNELSSTGHHPAVRSAATIEIARRIYASQPSSANDFESLIDAIGNDAGLSGDCQIETRLYYLAALTDRAQSLDLSTTDSVGVETETVQKAESTIESINALLRTAAFKSTPSITDRWNHSDRFVYHQIRWLKAIDALDVETASRLFGELESTQPQSHPRNQWALAAAIEIAAAFDAAQTSRLKNEGEQHEQDEQDEQDNQWLVEIYQSILASDPSTAAVDREAVAAKLAMILIDNRRIREAKSIADQRNETPLWIPVKTALAEQNGDFQTSERLWQQLERGLKPGTEDWFGARVSRLKAMYNYRPADAADLWKQTLTLYPDPPSDVAQRLRELALRWGNQ